MDVDGAVEDFVCAVADFVDELFAAFDAAFGAGEDEEEFEFDGGEDEGFAGEGGGAGFDVDFEVLDGDFGEGFGAGEVGALGAAEDGAEAGEEFAGGEGFGEVVVGA